MRRSDPQDLLVRLSLGAALSLGGCFQPQGKAEETTAEASSGTLGVSSGEDPGTGAMTLISSSEPPTSSTLEPTTEAPDTSTGEPTTSSTTGTTGMVTTTPITGDSTTTDTDGCVCGDGMIGCDEDCEFESTVCVNCKRTSYYVFVSSVELDATFNGQPGLAGADAICQQEAKTSGLPSATYLAWLSTDAESPASRFVQADRPYVLPGSLAQVAPDYDILILDGPQVPIATQADTQPLATARPCSPGNLVWTGTEKLGAGVGGEHCNNWSSTSAMETGVVGSFAAQMDGAWTACSPVSACDVKARLYCFEQP